MWEEYRSIVHSYRYEVRKVKAKNLELSPAEDVKDNGKDFCKYTENKRKGRKYLGLLLNEAGDTEHERGLGTECCLLPSFHEQALMNPSSERPGEKSGAKKRYLWWKLL